MAARGDFMLPNPNKIHRFSSHKLFRKAAVLTVAGLITRIMGFFFRIFLSHAFGEENVGLYQLIFPVYGLCLSISTFGIQTAVSHMVAEKMSADTDRTPCSAFSDSKRQKEAGNILAVSLGFTIFLSLIELYVLQKNASYIAVAFLGDARCENLLLIISYALPFAAIHSCICGYSFGLQQTKLPALSQLIEQSARILFVILLFFFTKNTGRAPSVKLAAAGIAAGEITAALFSIQMLNRQNRPHYTPSTPAIFRTFRKLFRLSVPLTANRAAVTLLQSIEAASIPTFLKIYGMTSSEALRLYGVLTGMALPCILFPSALTSSIGTVLMPAVSAAQASDNKKRIIQLLKQSVGSCFILGLGCCLFFLIFGKFLGTILFHSSTAGDFILTLSWICPFLYTNTALTSAINGLGKTFYTFLINTAGLLVRIAGVFLAIPYFGIQGYLIGLLVSQFLVFGIAVLLLSIHFYKEPSHL
ncbi:polysaccharide biosynthesis protein [Mediterraneibacter sp.]|uniref:polysaccharide biosynthesis protein n=1 Tax=Mediterraneibacter sp. TaxID=2316022 RepID=UPI0027B91266|nr:polysaccharide biosynthesis protein [Mediterraneibacter sp.]